jgi:NitT/TauT family transport system substrate-binding protein
MKYTIPVNSAVIIVYLVLAIVPFPTFAQPVEKVRIAYGARAIPFLPTFLAKEMGFYERQGLQAEAIQIAPRVVVSALTANEVDYTLTMGSTIRAAAQGLPVRGVSFSMRAPLFALVSRLGSPGEIKGKTIGVTFIGGLNHQSGKLMVSHLGLNPDKDVTFVAIGDEKLLLQSLLSGRIGAATMSPPWIFEAEKNGLKILLKASDVASLPFGGLGTTVDKIRKQRDQVKRAIKAELEALRFIRERKEETTQFITRFYGMSAEVARITYSFSASFFSPDARVIPEAVERYMEIESETSGGKSKTPLSRVVDLSLVEEVQKEISAASGR